MLLLSEDHMNIKFDRLPAWLQGRYGFRRAFQDWTANPRQWQAPSPPARATRGSTPAAHRIDIPGGKAGPAVAWLRQECGCRLPDQAERISFQMALNPSLCADDTDQADYMILMGYKQGVALC